MYQLRTIPRRGQDSLSICINSCGKMENLFEEQFLIEERVLTPSYMAVLD